MPYRMADRPQPGGTVLAHYDHTDETNRLDVVPNHKWDKHMSGPEIETVSDDEFVTQSRNSMGIMGKHDVADAWLDDSGQWHVDV